MVKCYLIIVVSLLVDCYFVMSMRDSLNIKFS